MASKVNVKFVVILSSALVALAVGVGGVFVFVKMRSGDRFVRLADAAMARNDYDAADSFYAKAVGKDQSNIEWLRKWREAREKKIPETQPLYEQDYQMYVYGILRTMATVERTDVNAHREYLQALYEERLGATGREAWESLANEVESSLRYFDEAPGQLRRFRGMAIAAIAAGGGELEPGEYDEAKADLEAAIAADPKDVLAANELAVLHRLMAAKAALANKTDAQQAALAEARRVMDAATAANPGDEYLMVSKLMSDVADAEMVQVKSRAPAELIKAREAALEPMKARLAETIAALEAKDVKTMNTRVLGRLLPVAVRLEPKRGAEMLAPLLDRAAAAHPEDAELHLVRARVLEYRGDLEGVISALDSIVKLPDRPVSLSGMRLFSFRVSAMFMQASAAVNLATRKEGAERTAALEQARKYRATLADNVPETSPHLTFVDAKLQYAQGDYRAAQRLLDQYLKVDSNSEMAAEGMLLLADVGLRLTPPQPGLTREYLQKVASLRPGGVELWVNLGSLELSMQNEDAALDAYQKALDLDPNHEVAKQQISVIKALKNEGEVDDPVMAKLIESDRLLKGDATKLGDEQAAIRTLEQAMSTLGADPRLANQLALLKASKGDREGAVAAIDASLAKNPDDAALKDLKARISASGSLENTLSLIDASAQPPLEKHMARYFLLAAAGKTEEAKKELDAAAKIAPDDARVLEQRFVDAANRKDLAEAARLVDRAVATDADRAEGDTFKARLLLAQGKQREAVSLLQRASERGNANAAVFRFLGIVQMELGRGPDAIKSFRRALELNPGDLGIARTYISALVQLGQNDQALAVARSTENVGRRDPEFLNLWLALESAAGNAQLARDMREQIAASSPENVANKAALVEIYIEQRAWDKARAQIDALRKDDASMRLVALDARWHAARGDVAKARQTFIAAIEALKNAGTLTAEPFMVMAQFMLGYGQVNWAIEALNNGVPLQDPKTMAIERALGEVLLAHGRFAEAEQTFGRIVAAGIADPDHALRKRYIEALVQQLKTQEAEREFVSLGAAVEGDVELLCQRAQNARNAGDVRKSREILDTAVARFPEDATPYVRRARLLMLDPAMTGDAMADLETAIRLQPGAWNALRTRASLHQAQGNAREALRDMRAALAANPGQDDLRFTVIGMLLEGGNETDAVDLAEAALKTRAGDARLLVSSGDTFARAGKWSRATAYYKRVWEQTGNDADGARYVAALMASTPINFREAEAFLDTPALNTTKSSALMMGRAAVRAKQRRFDQAQADAVQALSIALATQGGQPGVVLGWAEQVGSVFEDRATAQKVLDDGLGRLPAELAPWAQYARASFLASDPVGRSEALAQLQQLTTASQPELKLIACRFVSSLQMQDQKWQEALDAARAGLAIAPDDVMLNNNAAYFLSEKLGKAAEAAPYAEKAAAKDTSLAVMDTLAGVYWQGGDKAKAIRTIEGALVRSVTANDRARALIKLTGWKLEAGDKAGATAALGMLRELLIDNPSLAADVKAEADTLQSKMNS